MMASTAPPAASGGDAKDGKASPATTVSTTTIDTDEATAAVDNTANAMAASSAPHDTTNNGIDDLIKKDGNPATPTRLCESEPVTSASRKAARARWDFVKNLNSSAARAERREFKTGKRVSLTTAEATFLNMIAKSRLDGDHESHEEDAPNAPDGAVDEEGSTPRRPRVSGGTHFKHLIQAVVAKERLRDSIKSRLSTLSGAEANFLTKLVENESVTLEALDNAVHVLDNDPLYNANLREKSEFISDFDVGGLESDDEDEDALNEAEPLSTSARSRRSRRACGRRASTLEKGVWKLAHGEADEDFAKDLASATSLELDEDGLPLKTTAVGDAMDPLLMAVPMEQTPAVKSKKDLDDCAGSGRSSHGEKVGLDELLSSVKDTPALPLKAEAKEEVPSIVDERKEEQESVLAPFLVCCGGMEGLTLMGAHLDENADGAAGATAGTAIEEEEGGIESQKRYLHLEEQRAKKLSTWMGSPEDYPILGLKKRPVRHVNDEDELDDDIEETKTDEGEDISDPLEPHVLSPLLMKCLRDHLPYALREEQFWLKYSLVRDGASLDVIFQTMRHSQHAILAIETSAGEVLGSFTSSPWRSNGNRYYGSCEAFVWRLRKSRLDVEGGDSCSSLDEYILRESSLDCFKWSPKDGNRNVQLSNGKKLFVGGGNPETDEWQGGGHSEEKKEEEIEWGMALALDRDLLRGTSSRCATFGSSPLIDQTRHASSEVFEIMNMEIWALTSCMNEEAAEELELGRTFVMGGHKRQ
ncbi:hypothetical protein ACHAXT_007310 [Thalassiosira profunda]